MALFIAKGKVMAVVCAFESNSSSDYPELLSVWMSYGRSAIEVYVDNYGVTCRVGYLDKQSASPNSYIAFNIFV